MTDSANGLLEVDGLRIEFRSGRETVYAVNGAGFQVAPGETAAILGESGSGKSVTASVLMDILDSPPGRVTGGRVLFDDVERPAEAAGQLLHRHVENFAGGDDFDPVRHFHQREHRTMIVVQMRQEYRRYLVFGDTAGEQVLIEKRDRVD